DGDGEIMSDVYITEASPEKGSKMLFKYGFIDLWEFYCELLEVIKEKPAVNYPITVFRYGNMPLKAPSKNTSSKPSPTMMSDDFDDFDSFENDFDDDEG
ncbi:plasmid pRiA4b ORF-3 family protein, partial [Escherichia coli]|nr:plasmid pRiA4b ORF-3 family protein [Escherichia coli]